VEIKRKKNKKPKILSSKNKNSYESKLRRISWNTFNIEPNVFLLIYTFLLIQPKVKKKLVDGFHIRFVIKPMLKAYESLRREFNKTLKTLRGEFKVYIEVFLLGSYETLTISSLMSITSC
jgi:hypothetical protein